jgi:hypothetical protein
MIRAVVGEAVGQVYFHHPLNYQSARHSVLTFKMISLLFHFFFSLLLLSFPFSPPPQPPPTGNTALLPFREAEAKCASVAFRSEVRE